MDTAPGVALAAIPARYANPPAELLSKLPKPTSRENTKGHCSECGGWHGLPAVHLDYMGHADVTLALIEIDPTFDYGWITDPDGAMIIREQGKRLVLEGWLQVHGVKRLCVGTCDAGKMEPEKELIGDLLRNGAMRFGVATGLWSKSDAHESQDAPEQRRARRSTRKTEPDHGDDVATASLGPRAVAAVKAINGLPESLKRAALDWADGRSLQIPALKGDEVWLVAVEGWLTEHGVAA